MLLTRLSIITLLYLFPNSLAAPLGVTQRALSPKYEIATDRITKSLHDLSNSLDALRTSSSSNQQFVSQKVDSNVRSVIDVTWVGIRELKDPSVAQAGPIEALNLGLLGKVDTLASTAESTVNKWIGVKSIVISMGGKDIVIRQLRSMEQAADEFTKAMSDKMPFLISTVGKLYGERTKVAAERVILAFQS